MTEGPPARDRDADHRPHSARPRDGLGRPLAPGAIGTPRQPEGIVRTPAETFSEARYLLAEGKPFHAHEVFEDAWKADAGPTREFWRGMAQLAVGATHAARGNAAGAISLLERGAVTIAPFVGSAAVDVDIAAIIAWAHASEAIVKIECPVLLPVPPL